MEYMSNEIENLRKKLIDYYGSATPFFPIATADVIRIEQMTDKEIIEEAQKLRIV